MSHEFIVEASAMLVCKSVLQKSHTPVIEFSRA